MRISIIEMQDVLEKLFLKYKFNDKQAKTLAEVFTENTLCGVNSHGINRVPLFVEYLEKGLIQIDQIAKKAESFGSIERWDGQHGAGILNAVKCTNRAIELAKLNGMGLVALRNTNHWMRGGFYGHQAADAGCIAILFTNTQPNMPPWGGKESRIGNNPFIIAIPRNEGAIVLDMALSQFSFGKINEYKLKGENLPYPGGWNDNNELTNIPEEILPNERGLPIGYWKGSALSIILDMLATLLSAGDSTFKIGEKPYETGVSQVFLCIYPEVFNDKELQDKLLNEIIAYSQSSAPINPNDKIYYPGERSAAIKKENTKLGIPVNDAVWKNVLALLQK
tara:strand:- start:512 stop:1519 length:1008 start_codon:yes stop_codon:yes gene_type:complete